MGRDEGRGLRPRLPPAVPSRPLPTSVSRIRLPASFSSSTTIKERYETCSWTSSPQHASQRRITAARRGRILCGVRWIVYKLRKLCHSCAKGYHQAGWLASKREHHSKQRKWMPFASSGAYLQTNRLAAFNAGWAISCCCCCGAAAPNNNPVFGETSSSPLNGTQHSNFPPCSVCLSVSSFKSDYSMIPRRRELQAGR